MQHIAALSWQRWFRFVVAGTANTLVSQGALLVLLGVLPVIAATLLSQLLHAVCGYLTSARAVFGCSGSPQRYLLVVALSWLLQWQALAALLRAGLPRSQAVALLVPLLAGSTSLQLAYGASYLEQNYGCYSLARVSQWLLQQGWPAAIASAGGLLLPPIIHLLLLDLGAREAVANHCLLLPASIARQAWFYLGGTAFLVLLHGWLLWRLLAFVGGGQRSSEPAVVQLLFPLAMLLPTLYGAAHLRYLIPIIPLLLLTLFPIIAAD